MKNKYVFIVSLVIMIISLLVMCINRFVEPLPDIDIRVLGFIMLIDVFVLSYSAVKLNKKSMW